MAKKLRIGMIGLGGIAQAAHLPGYEKLLDKVELVAGSDISEEQRTKAAERFKIPKTYADYKTMLDREELDAVSVCTPPSVHAEASIAAMDRGIHVLCEKPVAMTAAEAQDMVDAAKRNKVKFMVAFQSRFGPEAQVLKEYIDAGELGDIYYAHAASLRRRGIPGWGVFTIKALSRGGPLIDIGVHILDLTIWLMGSPKPVDVMGTTYQKLGTRPGVNLFPRPWDPAKFETEDAAFAMVRFDNGATLYLETSWAINMPELHSTRLAGTKGGAETSPLRIFGETKNNLVDISPVIPEWQKRAGGQSTQDAKVKHFVDCILNDTQPITTPDEIVNLAKLIDAIYDSDEQKKMIHIG
jgi:predicted dehydrogenase